MFNCCSSTCCALVFPLPDNNPTPRSCSAHTRSPQSCAPKQRVNAPTLAFSLDRNIIKTWVCRYMDVAIDPGTWKTVRTSLLPQCPPKRRPRTISPNEERTSQKGNVRPPRLHPGGRTTMSTYASKTGAQPAPSPLSHSIPPKIAQTSGDTISKTTLEKSKRTSPFLS
ncbi:hypothetical protein BCR34DRAFT_555657 [Clohesyomyces aquaticus]|uniref:Uncharacterized protein n=1 Tax=Clohesyomyces aquaticus TaxID=1231657 RepID=A0A1Y2A5C0_9PLEO|nr:hypothetical protein BCR34DRAFT_555657 [Clohesyomyces aquaticus]